MKECYLNGDYVDLADAKVSVLDRGFIFGEGIYEVIGVHSRKPFALSLHLERLDLNLSEMGLSNPLSSEAWSSLISNLISRNGCAFGTIYIQITRGKAPRNHEFPKASCPTVFVMISESAAKTELEKVIAITAEDERWRGCHIKTTSLFANTRLRNLATSKGAAEAILQYDGYLTEGASSSVFIVSNDGVIYTSPLDSNILPGITREIVIRLSVSMGVPVIEEKIEISRLRTANEIWLTNTSFGIRCVSRLDEGIVGDGQQYEVAQRFHKQLCIEKGIMP